MEYIIAIGIFQALIAAILLWKSKLRNSADGILILLVACIATHLSIKFIIYTFITDHAVRHMMNTFINFCYGPLVYLYALKVRDSSFIPATKWYVFIPFIAGVVGYFSVISVLLADDAAGHRMLDWYNIISFWIFIPGDFFFSLLAVNIAYKQLTVASRERKLTSQLALCFLILSVAAAGFYILMLQGVNVNLFSRSFAYSLLVLICIRIISYRYVAFNAEMPPVSELPAEEVAMSKLTDTGTDRSAHTDSKRNFLPRESMEEIWLQLERQMKERSLFTDSDLSLDKLAATTGLSKYHISETLNHYAGKSFYQYINEYRVGHALSKLRELYEKNIPVNMLTLAYDAGFKSKSSFNRYFKEITGYTPTDYHKGLQGNMMAVDYNIQGLLQGSNP